MISENPSPDDLLDRNKIVDSFATRRRVAVGVNGNSSICASILSSIPVPAPVNQSSSKFDVPSEDDQMAWAVSSEG